MNRRGISLPDLLLAMTMFGLLVLIAAPRLQRCIDAAELRQAVSHLHAALDLTRAIATRLGSATIGAQENALVITAVSGVDTVVQVMRTTSALTISGLETPVSFGPAGLAVGAANRTIELSRGGAARSVILSRLGRIR